MTSRQSIVRVLNVIEDGRIAGPQLRMLRVAKALPSSVRTTIAVPDRGSGEFATLLESESVPFVRLSLSKLSRFPREIVRSLLLLPSETWQLARFIKASDFDVVHVSGGAWQFKGVLAGRLSRRAVVWHLNDTSSPGVFRHLSRLMLRRMVDCVIVAGARVREHYVPDFDERFSKRCRLFCINAPVDTSNFKPLERSHDRGEAVEIVTVGNVSPVKGIESVVRTAAGLKRMGGFRWRVIGACYPSQTDYVASLRRDIQALELSRFVVISGTSSNMPTELASSDIYVCTSRAEASPTAVWEAMACGLPIVSTDVGNVSEYVRDGVTGFVVPVGDESLLVERIRTLIENPALRRAMGERNRATAVEKLDIAVCAKQHEELYRYVISSAIGRVLR